jgi:hypothetical protein
MLGARSSRHERLTATRQPDAFADHTRSIVKHPTTHNSRRRSHLMPAESATAYQSLGAVPIPRSSSPKVTLSYSF